MAYRDSDNGAKLDAWTAAVQAMRVQPTPRTRSSGLFNADTVLTWNPDADALPNSELRFLLDWWRERAGRAGELPAAGLKLDPLALRPVLGYLMTLDAVEGGDFRFRLYGSKIAQRAGFDMTGRLVSEIPSPADTVGFFLATYRAVQAERVPLYTEHTPWSGISTTRWFRLILPFADGAGAITRFVVGNLPGAHRVPFGGTAVFPSHAA